MISTEGLDRINVPAAAAAQPAGLDNALPGRRLSPEALDLLRKEAAADPDKFIDEHEPYEVGLAFDLPERTKYQISTTTALQMKVRIVVNLTTQRLLVVSPGPERSYVISSGKAGHSTPGSGLCFAPDFLDADHHSSLYSGAPMPNSVFFNGNIAIHATGDIANLGKPASHGCIRMNLPGSKEIFDLVRVNGKKNAAICVIGKAP